MAHITFFTEHLLCKIPNHVQQHFSNHSMVVNLKQPFEPLKNQVNVQVEGFQLMLHTKARPYLMQGPC